MLRCACRCCMQKVPDIVSDGHVGTDMLAATSFGWVAKQIDMLTGKKGRSGVSIENIKTKGLRALRDNMVEYICKRIAKKHSAAPTSQAVGPADSAIDDDDAERQTAPQAAVAAQHQGTARVSAEGGNGGGGGDAAAGAEWKEEESGSSESGSGSESESEEEDEAVKQDEEDEEDEEEEKDEKDEEEEEGKGEEEEDGKDEEGWKKRWNGGKEKDEVGVEATTETGQEEAACEGSGKVPVDAGEGANITGVQETGEASGRQGPELDDVEELRRENWLLRAENARLATLLDEEKARLDRFFVGGQQRTGGGDGSVSVKRSKGADGSRGPGGSKPAAQSVVDQLKTKAGWKVMRSSHSNGDGSGGAEGGTADEVAAKVAAPEGPPLVAVQTHPQASGGKGVRDKEIPTTETAKDGGARTAKGPSVAVAGSTSIPRNPLAATTAPAGQSGANNEGPTIAAPLAPAAPSAAKGDAKAPAAKRDGPSAAKVPAGGNALRELLHRMETHCRDMQQPPVVDAALAETARRSVTPQVAGTSSGAPPAASQAHFEAAKRPEHAPALAIMDTAHVEPSATHGGGSAEPTAATEAVAEKNAGRKGKDDAGKGKAVSQRSTRAMSAGKEMSDEKGTKAGGNQDTKGGKCKSAKTKEEEDEAVGEGKKEHGRRGHGIRHDKSGDGLGWVGEIKVNGENRYIGKSRDKRELAYEHSIAYVVYDGYVGKVLMDELTVLKPGELEEWKGVWEEVKFLPTGMWTVMWARGLCHPRARFDDILGRNRGYTGSGDALHDVLLPAIWFPVVENTKAGKEEIEAFMSAVVNRVSMCAAYGKVAASTAFGKRHPHAPYGASWRRGRWCFVETGASVLGAVGEGKAAAMVAGAGEKRAEDFKKVMHAVIDLARNREAPAGEVAHNVAPALQRQAVDSAFKEGVVGVEADIIARATVETLAFWGMCPVAGPKIKEHGIDVPCDAQMEYDMEHRGRKGEKVKQGKGSKRKKRQTGKQGKDSTDA
ncbi:unnamed protein product [Closterium sp. Yama58-4]|nr:unnamed protein product [Closterium sp. Yama58-4]